MKVACIQLSTSEYRNKNFKTVVNLIKKAASNKAEFILTPETTILMSDNIDVLRKNSFEMNSDPFVKECKKICKLNNIWLLIGSIVVLEKKKLCNRSILISSSGRIIKFYDKINMFDVKLPNGEIHLESKVYKPGEKIVSAKLPWGYIGLSICFDLRFPELYRRLNLKNVSFIAIPSAFTEFTGKKHWLKLLQARAIENFCYVFAPAQYGQNTKKKKTYGHSVIISPDGKIMGIKKRGIGIIYSKINVNLPLHLRKMIPSNFKPKKLI